MPGIEPSDPQELRRCVRDLIALSALPEVWEKHDPHQIADSLAAALLAMLDAEFVYITLPGQRDEPAVDVTYTRDRSAESSGAVRRALLEWLPKRLLEDAPEIPDPLGEGKIHIAYTPIGLAADVVIIAGSERSGFPTEAEMLILRTGANQAAIAADGWRADTQGRRFAALAERSGDFIGFASLDGVPQYINPAGLQLVGLDGLDEAHREVVLDFVIPQERARVRDELWPVVMREGRWAGELTLRHFKTGAAIPCQVEWFRIDDPRTGLPMNVAIVSTDLTAQKRSEAELRHLNETLEQRVAERAAELAKANEGLRAEKTERERTDARLQELQVELFHAARLSVAGQMAAALAHELNQPLTAASNFINAARRGLANGQLTYADTIRGDMHEAAGQVLRAAQIIRRLRDFASRGETDKRIESVVTMVEEASALALTGTSALGVEARFCFDPDAAWAFADRIQIQQVLINMMRNALEAMAKSPRRELTVTTTRLDAETIEITVADSGPGLAEAMIDHLFEPFVSTKPYGMGLGLSICRSIVEAHNGRVGASENPRGGLCFRFTLAAAPADEADNAR